jgi:SagB-type dehydrogenase family enzyme
VDDTTTSQVPQRLRLWSLREDVLVEGGPEDDQLVVVTQWGDLPIDSPSPLVRESLRRMSLGPVCLENVLAGHTTSTRKGDGGDVSPTDPEYRDVVAVLDRLGCVVVHSLAGTDRGTPLLSATPVSRHATFSPVALDATQPVRLSRFAALRAVDDMLVLESPLARHRVELHDPAMALLVGSLAKATPVDALPPAPNIPAELVAGIVAYLVAAWMVVTGTPDPERGVVRFAEDEDPRLTAWSHHDLQFHVQSQFGWRDGTPTTDHRPLPADLRPPRSGQRSPLPRPDSWAEPVAATDRPPPARLTMALLGELLHRVAGSRAVAPAGAGRRHQVVRDWLNPQGGRTHEFELYVTVTRCAGLAPGIYHYDPLGHALTLINTSTTDLAELLDNTRASGLVHWPLALITITLRIAPLSWAYEGIAYSTALRHVGLLQQMLRIVAGEVGLASRALAVGDVEVSDRALGLDWPAEVSVGEFALGTGPHDDENTLE